MFDTIIDTIRTEAAIQGPRGITSDRLWGIVETTIAKNASAISNKYENATPLIDLAYKCCFWPILLEDKHLEFYEDLDATITVEASTEQQQQLETTTEIAPSTEGQPDNKELPTTTHQEQQNEPLPVEPNKKKAPAKKPKNKPPLKKKAKKVVKKPSKKKAKKQADSDGEYSSDGYEPPSDDEESTDEEEYEDGSDASQSSEEEEEEVKKLSKSKNSNEYDPLVNLSVANYRRIDEIEELSFDKVEQLYGPRLRILADKKLQTEQLYVGTPPSARSLSPNLQIVLTFIMQAGPAGITQANMTKMLELDPRSSGHYVKVLEQKGAITRKPVAHHGFRTNICVHVRYSVEDTEQTSHELNANNVNASGVAFSGKRLRARLIDLLSDAKENVMYSDDILSALGFNPRDKLVKKWYHRAVDDLCAKNIVRKVRGEITKIRTSRCIQLVDPEQATKERNKSTKLTVHKYQYVMGEEHRRLGGVKLVLKIAGAENRPAGAQYYDTSLESQIVDVLQAASTNGATQKEIMYSLSYGETKGMHKYLDNMSCLKESPEVLKYIARRAFEFEGRIRRYRYYSYQAYEKLKKDIDIDVTGPPVYHIANSKLKVENFKIQKYALNSFPPSRGGRKPANRNTPETALEPATVSSSSSSSSTAAVATEVPGTPMEDAEESTTPLPSSSTSSENTNNQSVKLAPIFQRQQRATRSTGELDDGTQNSNDTVASTTRKRTRRELIEESEEGSAIKVPRRPGRPARKSAKAAAEAVTAATAEALANIDETTESVPEIPTDETTNASATRQSNRLQQPENSGIEVSEQIATTTTTTEAAEKTAEATLVPRKRGRPHKKKPTLTENEESETISKAPTEETEAPVARKRGRPPKKKQVTTAKVAKEAESSEQPEPQAMGITDVTAGNQTINLAVSANNSTSSESGFPTTEKTNKRPTVDNEDQDMSINIEDTMQPSTLEREPSPQSVAASPRRGNLFDYFTSSRNSPGPSSPRRQQNTCTRTRESSQSELRNHGRLLQQLVEVRLNAEPIATNSQPKDQENMEIDRDDTTTTTTEASFPAEASPSPSNEPTTQPSQPALPSQNKPTTSNLSSSLDKSKSKTQGSSNVFRTKLGIKSTRHTRQGNNAYQEQRQKVLLALLDEDPIWERSHDLKSAFISKMRELYPNGAERPGLCLKTLWKSAEDLVGAGKAQFHDMTFTHINASKVTKKLFFRMDIDVNGPEIQEYMDFMKEKRTLRSSRPNRLTKYEKLDNKVERLEERLERMEEKYEALEDKQGIDAIRLDEEIRVIKANMGKVTKLEEAMGDVRTTSGNWLTIGLQFGFVHARMLRAKLFHQHMFGLLNQDIDGVDRETRTIKTSTLISWMTLNLYCQTIGIFFPYKELLDFTEDESNMEKYMWELPDSIKMDLFSSETKFRYRIRTLTDVLEGLGLIKVKSMKLSETYRQFRSEAQDLPDSYQVLPTVLIRDYRRPDMKIIGNYTMDSPSDLLIYWSDLQYISTDVQPLGSTEGSEPAEETQQTIEMKRVLFTGKNWSAHSVIDRELRNQLNSYIDADTKMTPIEDPIKCKSIATELQIPFPTVILYFRKMQMAFDRQLPRHTKLVTDRLENQLKPKRRKPRKRLYHGERDDVLAKRVFQRTDRGSTKRRLLKELGQDQSSSPDRGGSNELYLDNEAEMPLIHDDDQVEKARLRRLTRTPWRSDEDELLIYLYVIMKHHCRTNKLRFLWSPGHAVFPHRTLQQLRARIDKIKVMPAISEYIFTLNRLWSNFYEQGIEDGAFEREAEEIVNYNILARLSYLIQRLQDVNEEMAKDNPLPTSLKELHRNFRVERTMNPSEKERGNIEDQFHQKVTMLARNRVLITKFLTMNSTITTKLDYPIPENVDETNPKRRIIGLLKIFLRMVLLTPFEAYDPFFAHAVINSHPSSVVSRAIEEMRSSYQIAKTKGERSMSRKLPAMSWSISKRYLHDMACSLPENFFLQATEYEKFLCAQGKSLFMPILVSSGMMGSILDLLSEDKLDLYMVGEEHEREKYQEPIHTTRTIDQTKLDFNVGLENITFKEDRDMVPNKKANMDNVSRSSTLTMLPHNRMETELSGFFSSQSPALRPIFKAIMEFLESVKEVGATIFEIKDKLLENFPDITDSEIRKYIEILRNTHPPFIHLVGFESLRYVCTNHLGNWVVQTRGLSPLTPSSVEATERARIMNEKRTELIDPRLWIDLNGAVTKKLLEECLQIVFQRVMERPGILERDVRRLFENQLSYAEVKDLLDMLVARGAIRKVIIISTGSLKKTLFSKPRKYTKAAHPDVIDRSVQTSYFPTRGYFRKLAPKCETEQ
ncbi:hypothetical protein BDA99DRAFT_301296 [Phascolomyces articulosus]|uniref:B-block binding subunit of TFIIIC domain-containing protein n=1 Tax=Phascolomyces articulosus TaxID=60185 RepID=A0AAD5K6F6_9FUNG|nr:hypothetical protein BDA99DRAFT_301296 [Phascolomyces articulosus]